MGLIQLHSDWAQIDAEIDRLASLPGPKGELDFKTILDLGYALTQEAVHVETGTLKASGKVDSKTVGPDWTGDITYGGDTTITSNGVSYAIYEQARGIGGAGGPSDLKGDHDFLAPTTAIDPMFEKAVEKVLFGD